MSYFNKIIINSFYTVHICAHKTHLVVCALISAHTYIYAYVSIHIYACVHFCLFILSVSTHFHTYVAHNGTKYLQHLRVWLSHRQWLAFGALPVITPHAPESFKTLNVSIKKTNTTVMRRVILVWAQNYVV